MQIEEKTGGNIAKNRPQRAGRKMKIIEQSQQVEQDAMEDEQYE